MFKNHTKEDILIMFNCTKHNITNYSKNDIIALEGSNCTKVGIILSGKIDIKRILTSNSTLNITSLEQGSLFGEVIAFSDINKYPATVVSSSNSSVLFVEKDDFINYCTANPNFLKIFLNDLTNKVVTLNASIAALSLSTIKQKISHFIISEYKNQNSIFIKINMTKQKLAETLGVPRPSLSRELINMKELGLIDYSKDYIKILDKSELEKILMQ